MGIERLLEAADEAGAGDRFRYRMRGWLFEPETNEEAWAAAQPVFGDEAWPVALDRRLEQGPAVVPALLRVGILDQTEDRDRRLRLNSQAMDLDHPWSVIAAASYFGDLAGFVPKAEFRRELRRYLDRRPDDDWCRFILGRYVSFHDAESAKLEFDILAADAEENDLASVLARYGNALLALARGDLPEARALTMRLPLVGVIPYLYPEDVLMLRAELAIADGEFRLAEEILSGLEQASNPRIRTSAMVLSWIDLLGRGTTPLIDEDVARWLEHEDLTQLRHSSSTVIEALLLTEGRVDLDWLHRAAGDWYPETVEFIEVLRASSDGSGLDLETLAAIAGSENPNAWGPMWARHLIHNAS